MKQMHRPGKRKSLINGKAGSATMELALVLPMFLLLVFGIFEFGRAWMIINTMNHAAREAVRVAATTASLTVDDSAVIGRANTILDAATITGAVVHNTAPAGTPPQVAVNIALTYTWMTQIGPLLGFNFTGSIPLAGAATMRYER